MKYHIDTIPVWDAMKLDSECLLCALRRKQELIDAERYLGGSVMEPAIRMKVNEKGFCTHHQALLYSQQNKLGHALMMHSRLKETQEKVRLLMNKAVDTIKATTPSSAIKRNVFRANSNIKLKDISFELDALINECVICESVEENMQRYTYTLMHLYKIDLDFRRAFESSKGICLKDASILLSTAESVLPGNVLNDFVHAISRLTNESLSRVESELEWFTQKFDYRNADLPWGNSRDALERVVTKLCGWCIGAEPSAKDT